MTIERNLKEILEEIKGSDILGVDSNIQRLFDKLDNKIDELENRIKLLEEVRK